MNKFAILLLFPLQLLAQGNFSYQYINRVNDINNKYLSSNSWEVNLSDNQGHFRHHSKFRYTPGPLGTMVSVGELFYINKWRRSELWIGKKMLNWDQFENSWNLGILNPQEGFNLMDNNREGLLSIGISQKINKCEVELAVSPINFPQLNPASITKNGKIIGKNEWSISPPSRVIFNNQDTPVEYEVITPEVSKLITTPMIGGYISCGKNNNISLYIVSKAENQVRVSANGAFDANKGRVLVQAKPFINRHTVFGSSVSKLWNNQKISLGFQKIVPNLGNGESFTIEKLKIEPVFMNESNITLGYKLKRRNLAMMLDYIHTLEGRQSTEGVFTKKAYWLDAVALDVKYSFGEKLKLTANYKYDFVKKDMLTSANFAYKFNNHYSTLLGYQILNAPDESSFWANYRSNDAVYSEVTYTF